MCIYKWLVSAEDPLRREKPGPRGPHRLDSQALEQHVADFPDHTQLERAAHFGVSKSCIHYALGKLNITRKKKTLTYKQQCRKKRQLYLDALDSEVLGKGKTPAYVDECGFPSSEVRRYAYAPRGSLRQR